MSKLVIILILLGTVLPFIFLTLYYEQKEMASFPAKEPFVMPVVDPNDSRSGQCAICAQIADEVPKAECMKNFECS